MRREKNRLCAGSISERLSVSNVLIILLGEFRSRGCGMSESMALMSERMYDTVDGVNDSC